MTGRTAETNGGGEGGTNGKGEGKGGGRGRGTGGTTNNKTNERTNGSHHLGFPAYCLNNVGAKFDANRARIASAMRIHGRNQ